MRKFRCPHCQTVFEDEDAVDTRSLGQCPKCYKFFVTHQLTGTAPVDGHSGQVVNFQGSSASATVERKPTEASSIEELLRAFNEGNYSVKESATYFLGKTRDPRAVDALIAALKDPNRSTRNIIDALGEIGNAKAVDALIALLSDYEEGTRTQAAIELGKIGDKRAVEPLKHALTRVRVLAGVEGALKALGVDGVVSPHKMCPKCAGGTDVYRWTLFQNKDYHLCTKCGYKDFQGYCPLCGGKGTYDGWDEQGGMQMNCVFCNRDPG